MLRAGTTVSGYRIESLVGEGGMATVYQARQISLNREVALKVLARRLGDDPSFRERFRREWQIQARLDHPNIVPIFEAGESEHGLWLAMRLVRGPTLRERLGEGRPAPLDAIRLLAPIAGALDVAHGNGLIHRDVTPQNILIDERDHLYLSDFGITKGPEETSLTRTGQFVGTLDYLAPEQILDEPSTGATDTYALGAILFECLTGRVPFQKSTEVAMLYAHLSDKPPRVSSLNPNLPKAIDPVIVKALAKKPKDRFGSATELIAAAEHALKGPTVERRARRSRRRSGGRRRAGLGLAAAVLLAGASLGLGLLSSDGSAAAEKRVTAGDLAISLPSGWEATRDGASVPGLPLSGVITLEPGEGKAPSVLVGTSAATGKALLPPAWAQRVGPVAGESVSLGALEALRYRSVRRTPSAPPLAIFVAPASFGVATIVCRPYRAGSEHARACEELASTLKPRRGHAYPLGPSPRLETVLRKQLDRLNGERRRLRLDLSRAADASQQAASASGLGAAYARVARELASQRVTPQSVTALAALVAALRGSRDGYAELAAAAREEEDAAYATATDAVREAEAVVNRRLSALRSLGYGVEGPG